MQSRLLHALLDLLFPPRCILCRKPGTVLCAACLQSFPLLPRPLCPRCARPLDGRICRHKHIFRALDRLDAACPFEGSVREAIHALKYDRVRSLAAPLGRLLAATPAVQANPDALIVPVPLHSTRIKERGFNQSELLAVELAGCSGLPLVRDCLYRTRATASQTHLGIHERAGNVRDAFACRDRRFAGHLVILVDDVCTTGSTLEACAVALKAEGATTVTGLTLARAGE